MGYNQLLLMKNQNSGGISETQGQGLWVTEDSAKEKQNQTKSMTWKLEKTV